MLPTLGDLLPYAIPVALSPLPVIAVVMLLLAPAGTRGGLGFLAGRVAALAAVAFAVALLAGRLARESGGADRGAWIRIALGCLLIAGAWLVWRRGPAEPSVPGWLRALDGAAPAGALRLGALLTVANPKELAFVAGAGTIIGAAAPPAGQALALALVFAAIAALGVAAPLAWAAASGAAARARLAALRDGLVRHQALIMAAILVLIGTMLVGSGLKAL
ncbi:MAG: GAP family protein [Amaricoccus sp.]